MTARALWTIQGPERRGDLGKREHWGMSSRSPLIYKGGPDDDRRGRASKNRIRKKRNFKGQTNLAGARGSPREMGLM